jgi:hypothetical protein
MRRTRINGLITAAAVLTVVSMATAYTAKPRTGLAGGDGPPLESVRPPVTERKGNFKRNRFRVALTLIALAAVASTSVGLTLAMYSNKPTGQANTFSSGTVTLTNSVSGLCTPAVTAPGDGTVTGCTLTATYGGTLPAWLGLDVFVATKSSAAGGGSPTNLYDGTTSGGQITVSDNQTTPVNYVVAGGSPTNLGAASNCTTAGPDGVTYSSSGYGSCYLKQNLLVSTNTFSSGTAVTFTTTITLAATVPNSYQGGSAVVVLAVHAVQSAHNALSPCVTAGLQCSTLAWT